MRDRRFNSSRTEIIQGMPNKMSFAFDGHLQCGFERLGVTEWYFDGSRTQDWAVHSINSCLVVLCCCALAFCVDVGHLAAAVFMDGLAGIIGWLACQ